MHPAVSNQPPDQREMKPYSLIPVLITFKNFTGHMNWIVVDGDGAIWRIEPHGKRKDVNKKWIQDAFPQGTTLAQDIDIQPKGAGICTILSTWMMLRFINKQDISILIDVELSDLYEVCSNIIASQKSLKKRKK